ncbi:MAG: 50S ribosomal protein L20 [Candidatus Magasanikbacteria bacterium]|nr:50S ribosomal protein L20 [Candidatus Magasanikbacteria bacterium]
MARIKGGLTHTKHRRGILKHTKGYRWGRKSKIKVAKVAKMKAGAHAFVGRRLKKRLFRANWNVNINAAVRAYDLSYSKFIGLLKKKGIGLNRKVLVEIAEKMPKAFEAIIAAAKK